MKYFHGETENVRIKALRHFHNYVKFNLYDKLVSPGKTNILELAAGRGADLYKYLNTRVSYVLAVNSNKNALDIFQERYNKSKNSLKINFIQADLTKNVTNIIGKIAKKNFFDIVSIQFAFHYFLKNKHTLDNIFKNINSFLKSKGHFMITGFDGERVNYLLRNTDFKDSYNIYTPGNKKEIFKITKLYKGNILKNLGQEIDVFVQTIGAHQEYLVNYDYIIPYFESNGYTLIETKYFNELYNAFYKKYSRPLSQQELLFTSLNRYAIFKKN